MAVSRKFVGEAKGTVCGDKSQALSDLAGGNRDPSRTQVYTKTKVFTVYLPQGVKKSVLLNPMLPLVKVLEKICFARNIKLEEYISIDSNGAPVPLNTLLGKIPGAEITFTKKDQAGISSTRILPPTLEAAYHSMGLNSSSGYQRIGAFSTVVRRFFFCTDLAHESESSKGWGAT